MVPRYIAAAGGLLLALGVGTFVAERAGWFGTDGWRDAVPGLGPADTTPPVDRTVEPTPAPENRPPQQDVARPDRKPVSDAVAPDRKPDIAAPTAQAEREPSDDSAASDGEAEPAVAETANAGDRGGSPDAESAAASETDPGDGQTAEQTADTGTTADAADESQAAAERDTGERQATDQDDPAAESTGEADGEATASPQPAETATADRSQASEGGADGSGETRAVRDPDAGMEVTVPAQDGDGGPPRAAEVTQDINPQIPAFDIVRVERSGEAVIAGRAAPRSRVTVMQGDQAIATAETNARGEFVAIPHRPLPPGQRQLTLRSEHLETGEQTESDRAVVIDIPRRPSADAPAPAAAAQTAERDHGADDGSAPDGPQVTARTPSDAAKTGPGEAADTAAERRRLDRPREDGPRTGASRQTSREADAGTDRKEPAQTNRDRTNREASGQDPTATRSMRPRAERAEPSEAASETSRGPGDAPIAVLVPRQGTGEVEVLQRPSGETGLQRRDLVLNAVQYTVDGGISISGRAPAEATVIAYLNDTELARTRAPTDGDWSMSPDADVPPGLHTLRIDQLGPDGGVEASVSTPFANQPMVDELDADEGMVVIQPGDNLWTIARRTYGQGWEYTLIYRANSDQIRDPDLIYPGQVFVVPEEQRRRTSGQ